MSAPRPVQGGGGPLNRTGQAARPRESRPPRQPHPTGLPDLPKLAELLDRVAHDSLRWISDHRAHFRLPPDAATDADPDTTLKPLGELAELALVIGQSHPSPALRARAEELSDFAWGETREGELFAELIRGEPRATYPVELYGVFAQTGLRNAGVDAILPAVTGLRGWRVAREDHTRTLTVLNAERRIGLPPHADFDAVLAHTGLGRTQEPWSLDRRAAYGVTHDVFHLTDWGRSRRRMPGELCAYLRLWLPAWLECWFEEELWDLAGELLAVAACLTLPAVDPVAWERLAAAQAPDGSVPDRGTLPEGLSEVERFARCYHATLVTAFAATLARRALGSDGALGADGTLGSADSRQPRARGESVAREGADGEREAAP